MTVNVYFEDLNVGDEMPAWSRQTDFMHWNRYAAVNDEFVPFHMDDEAGRKAGNKEGAFGMGNLRYAYLVNALRDWIGDEAEIREIGCQYRAINQKNDTLTVVGKVVEKEMVDGENRDQADHQCDEPGGRGHLPRPRGDRAAEPRLSPTRG